MKLQIVGTNPANRIPLLQSGKVDLIVGDLTNTAERAKVIDFSDTYFISGQQVLVPAGSSDKLADYATARVGTVKGTTGENQIKTLFPKVKAISFDDLPLAFAALRAGNVQAITQDGTLLVDALARSPDKAKFKILPDLLSNELIGIGANKGTEGASRSRERRTRDLRKRRHRRQDLRQVVRYRSSRQRSPRIQDRSGKVR